MLMVVGSGASGSKHCIVMAVLQIGGCTKEHSALRRLYTLSLLPFCMHAPSAPQCQHHHPLLFHHPPQRCAQGARRAAGWGAERHCDALRVQGQGGAWLLACCRAWIACCRAWIACCTHPAVPLATATASVASSAAAAAAASVQSLTAPPLSHGHAALQGSSQTVRCGGGSAAHYVTLCGLGSRDKLKVVAGAQARGGAAV